MKDKNSDIIGHVFITPRRNRQNLTDLMRFEDQHSYFKMKFAYYQSDVLINNASSGQIPWHLNNLIDIFWKIEIQTSSDMFQYIMPRRIRQILTRFVSQMFKSHSQRKLRISGKWGSTEFDQTCIICCITTANLYPKRIFKNFEWQPWKPD